MEPPGSCQSCRQAVTESLLVYRKGDNALVHNQAEVSALVSVYALISRMRVVSSSSVVEKAEAVAHLIIDTYFTPNRSFSDVRELVNGPAADPLRNFSEACRTELRTLK